MKKKIVLLIFSALTVTLLVITFSFLEQIILNSKLYTIKNLTCNENFRVTINPDNYFEVGGEQLINRYIGEKHNTTIKLKKILIDSVEKRVNLYISLENKWKIIQGRNIVLFTVVDNKNSRSVTYDSFEFSISDSEGFKVPYSQYSLNNDSIIISIEKDIFFSKNGKLTLDFSLNKCIEYKLAIL